MLIANNAEGGTDTTAVTTGNSGDWSGHPWENVQPDSQTLEFSTAQAAHGGLSYHISLAASGGPFVGWSTSTITVSTKTMYSRMYLYYTASPPTVGRIMQFTNSSIQLIGGVGIDATDHFTLKDSAGTAVSTSSATLPLNAWLRLEMMVFSSATVGQVELKIFLTPDSITPDEVVTSAANLNTRGDDIQAAIFGLPTIVASSDFYMDDIAIQDTSYIGPVFTAPSVRTSPVQNVTTNTATGYGIVDADGGSTITERGICWNTSANPTTSNSKATSAGTTGSFSASLTGLSNNTTYYVRAYATNSIGTTYGENVTFTHTNVPAAWYRA